MISAQSRVDLHKFLLKLLCLCTLVAVCLPSYAAGQGDQGDWWMFHHDPQHTGRSAFNGPSTPLLKWKYATGGIINYSSPAIGADGTIYVGSWDDNLYALNPADGSLKWKFATGGYIDSSPAIGVDGTIYVGSWDHNLYALNQADGSLKWKYTTGSNIYSSPALGSDGTIYVGSDDDNLYALNPADGSLKSKYAYGSSESSPAIGADGTIYFVSGYYLNALDPVDGSLKWQSYGGGISSPAIGADGTIYVGSDGFNLYALNPSDGSLKWSYDTGSSVDSTPAIGADGTIYVGSLDYNFYALNPADGSLKWTYPTENYINSSPAIGADGTIYFGSDDDNLYALNSADGSLKWIFATGNMIISSPALGADGTIYVGSNDDNLYAISQGPTLFTVTPTAGINGTISQSTAQTVSYGCSVSFTATPNIGYGVSTWSVDGTVVQNGLTTFILNNIIANHNVIVTFGLNYSVTPCACANGAISPYNAQTVVSDGSLVFTAIPNIGYMVSSWSVDGTVVQTGGTMYILTNIIANHTVSVTFTSVSPNGQGDWWMFHHDRQHTGRSPFIGPSIPSLKCKYVTGDNGYIYSSPAIGADGTIYVGSSDGNLYVFNQADASLKWKYDIEYSIVSSPAIGIDGTIYVGAMNGNLYALNPADGSLKWTYLTENYINSSPAIGTDGTIYIGTGDFNLYALNPADGSLKWKYATGNSINESSPVISSDGTIYIGSYDGNLYALNPADGSLKWKYASNGEIDRSSPAIGADGTIYVGSTDHNFYALNPTDGSLKWKYTTGNSVNFSPVIGADGTVYVGSYDNYFYALNPTDGSLKWKYSTGYGIGYSLAIDADGTIYVGSGDNNDNLYALNTADGSLKWKYTISSGIDSSPAIGTDGTIYIGSFDDNLYAIGQGTPITFKITPSVGINGTINPSNAQTVTSGGSITFTATPNTGYAVNTWSVDGTEVQLGGLTYTLTNVTANHTVTVTFTPLPLSSVSLTANPISPRVVNTAITLTAAPTGGSQVQYMFRVGYSNATGWVWTNLTASYTNSATCTWTPSAVGSYTLVVWARNAGETVSYDKYASISYQVTAPALSAVALSAKPTTPQPANMPITLTATPTGGSQVQYIFRVGSASATGWIWTNLSTSYTTTATCTWTPSAVGSYLLVVWARNTGETVSYDKYASIPYQVTMPALTAVALTAKPTSPQPMNTAITLTATPTGGGQVQYMFRQGYTNASGWVWTNLTASYTTSATCTWKPATAGTFTLIVWARLAGESVNYDKYASLSYQVTAQPLTAVALSANPASPQPANTPITLKATPTGGSQVQYMFRLGYTNASGWVWTNLIPSYTTTASCTWTPSPAGTYTLVVWARNAGETVSYDKYASISYQVTAPALTGVAISANPASPQPANTPITLTATPTGGSQVLYMFRIGYTNAAGWVWTNLNSSYMTTATCTWKPSAAGTYSLVVWARNAGETVSYDKYASISYQVTAPALTAVALSANPASPQPVNTPITLTAAPTGGNGLVQYLFRVGSTSASGWVWTNLNSSYTTTATCTWTPTTTGTFTLVVWARAVGQTVNYDAYNSITYQVTKAVTASELLDR